MPKSFTVFAVAAFLAAVSFAAPNIADAKSDKAVKATKAQAQDCLKLSDPKKKDECVKKAQKSGKGVSKKADKAAKKGMEKAKGKK
jgi:hypothetical protein